MRYEGNVFRPPSEAYSLIIQATIGCAHNRCTFCGMYKNERFRIKALADIVEDMELARRYYPRVERVFLADGDALCIPFVRLKEILLHIKEIFPECERVGIYASPKDILRKSLEELTELRDLGLGIIYMGLESGSDDILAAVHKGNTAEEAIRAGKKVVESGIKLSVTVISGLGGRAKWEEHAVKTGEVLSAMDPHYVGLLTLMLVEGTEMKRQVDAGEMELLSPEEIMRETRLMLEHTDVTGCIFRSNHASNYVTLKGTLPQDKAALIRAIDRVLAGGYHYKPEFLRGL
ncbi:MAG TPA: radical SAM protein [Clostridia bacterium]|nr:radical SAM protein [Clostridia bacterium]